MLRFAFNLTRVWQHYQNSDFAIISAFIQGDPESDARHVVLKKTVQDFGYGYVEIKGHWILEYGPDQGKPTDEYSLFIPNVTREDALFFASGDYHDGVAQYSIVYADQDGIYELLTQDGSGKALREFTKLETNFQAAWRAWSEHRGRRWRYSVAYDMIEPPPVHPKGWAEHRVYYGWRDDAAHEYLDGPRPSRVGPLNRRRTRPAGPSRR